jgi:hypothetical protein
VQNVLQPDATKTTPEDPIIPATATPTSGALTPTAETEVTHRYVVELPPFLNKVEWQEEYGRTVEPIAALEPTQ